MIKIQNNIICEQLLWTYMIFSFEFFLENFLNKVCGLHYFFLFLILFLYVIIIKWTHENQRKVINILEVNYMNIVSLIYKRNKLKTKNIKMNKDR